MQKIIQGPFTFHDKDIISIQEVGSGLDVVIGEDKYKLFKVTFNDVLGYSRTLKNDIQGLIMRSDTNEFMNQILVLNYDPKPFPKDHPYKLFVFYSSDQDGVYTEPVLEVIASDIVINTIE
jgi:hypothetical protein